MGIAYVISSTLIIMAALILAWRLMKFSESLIQKEKDSAATESLRLLALAESAMTHIKSKSIEEKVRADALSKNFDVQLALIKDSFAKEAWQTKSEEKTKEREEFTFMSSDGRQLTSKDFEVLG